MGAMTQLGLMSMPEISQPLRRLSDPTATGAIPAPLA
jgi:hypothetical protein